MPTRRNLLLAASVLGLSSVKIQTVLGQDGDSTFEQMLRALPPLSAVPGDPPLQVVNWIDVQAVTAFAGYDGWPAEMDDIGTLIEATSLVPLDSALFSYAAIDLETLLGFSLVGVDQVLVAYEPPYTVRSYRGQFDADRITAAFTAQDYVESQFGDSTVLASPSGDDVNIRSEIGQIAPTEFNYLLVSDSAIMTTGTQAMLDLILQQPTSTESLLTSFGDSPIPSLVAESSGALVFDGKAISADELQLEPTEELSPLPPAIWFAGDVTLENGDRLSRYLIEFEESAAEDAADVISERIETGISVMTGQPLASVFGPVEVSVLPDSGVVQIAGTSDEFSRNWYRAIYARDLAFLATE